MKTKSSEGKEEVIVRIRPKHLQNEKINHQYADGIQFAFKKSTEVFITTCTQNTGVT
jgi:hypothetical protein